MKRSGGIGGREREGKEAILDLGKYLNQEVEVKFTGGREIRGILKGFDALVNLVIDECVETLREPTDPHRTTEETRKLGLVVCRGSQVMLISPVDGFEQIENPWSQQQQQPL